MPNPDPGTVLGPYSVEGVIGAGSMGDVYRGVDSSLNRKVAITLLSEKHRHNPELRARFIRDGRAVAAISHPNVVQVFTTGTFDERPYIAMEFLDGHDLGTMIEENGPLDSRTAAQAVLDAAHGLAAAARAGLIHRDVKPSNLVRLHQGTVKVTDFGLAKPVDPGTEPALTALGVVVGTPDYIAPEQARGEPINESVDIYALGGSLFFMLTGVPPFRTGIAADDKYLKVVARHLRHPAPDARDKRPDVDEELAELVRQMMAKKVAERPNYEQLTEQLASIISRLDHERNHPASKRRPAEQRPATPVKVPVIAVTAKNAAKAPEDAERTIAERGNANASASLGGDLSRDLAAVGARWIIAITVISVVALVAAAIFFIVHDRGGKSTTSAPTTPSSTAAKPNALLAQSPTVPAGMVLVKRADGTPWFFIDAAPVTHRQFAKIFVEHHVAATELDHPVTNVAYNVGRAFAQTRSGHLATAEQWEAAIGTVGVHVAPGLSEWIDDEAATTPHAAGNEVRTPGQPPRRIDAASPDVTFRVVIDLSK